MRSAATTVGLTTTADPAATAGCHEDRPWGSWTVLDQGAGWKVKQLVVEPGCRLSLQTHARRTECWIVVSGVASCVVGRRRLVLHQGERVQVPRWAQHRISNDQDFRLVILEIQHGDYLGEDDIVRLEDDYGRVGQDHPVV